MTTNFLSAREPVSKLLPKRKIMTDFLIHFFPIKVHLHVLSFFQSESELIHLVRRLSSLIKLKNYFSPSAHRPVQTSMSQYRRMERGCCPFLFD